MELNDGVPFPDFADRLRETSQLSPPAGVELDDAKMRAIRKRVRDLLNVWETVAPELTFCLPASTART